MSALTNQQIKEMAFYITNNMESEEILRQDVRITAIESVVKQLIGEFLEKISRLEIERYNSKKIHLLRNDGLAWCHTLAKNPRTTNIPDFVTCRRCLPEAIKQRRIECQL